MITESTIYWITRLDNFHSVLTAVLIIGAFCLVPIVVALIQFCDDSTHHKEMVFGIKLLCTVILFEAFTGIGKAFLPTTREMCAIKVIPAIANNENIREIGNGLTDLAREWLIDLKPNVSRAK